MSNDTQHESAPGLSRRQAVTRLGLGLGALGAVGAGYGFTRRDDVSVLAATPEAERTKAGAVASDPSDFGLPVVERVAAEPYELPGPIHRRTSRTIRETLTIREAVSEIEPGVFFPYMTFDGQIPGRMLRVRQGDEVHVRLENPSSNRRLHNIDFHAVFGPGGGAEATNVGPGQGNEFVFQARYPGAFVYHCAIPMMDMHISSGMFGLIVVEPPEGLPEVDREIYLGQHEVYTNRSHGEKGNHDFSLELMKREDPSYVLLNGAKYGLTGGRHGAVEAHVGETVRVFFANGGPNLTSSFHPIGNVFSKLWREGAVMSNPERWVQTASVPPGSALVGEMELEVPGEIKLVDHALSRVARKGMLGVLDVKGPEQAGIFRNSSDAEPLTS